LTPFTPISKNLLHFGKDKDGDGAIESEESSGDSDDSDEE